MKIGTMILSLTLSMTVVGTAMADPVVDHGTALIDASELLNFTRGADGFTEGLGGAAWLDYDNDGDLDLYLVNGVGQANGLFRNDGGGFTNVATESGVANGTGSAGVVAGDIDNDGCTDLFVLGAGGIGGPSFLSQPHRLYINNCDGTFSDVSATSGITGPQPAMMAAFGDIDNDGYLDLFVTNPGSFVSGMLPQVLYHNNGDRSFTDISASAGIDTATGGCVVGFTDYNNDGRSDIIVGSCNKLIFPGGIPTPVPGPWELWRNNGDLTFTDVASAAGLDVRPGFPMALTLSDYDGDGDFDFFGTGLGISYGPTYGLLAEQVLFQNNGDGTYSDATAAAGLTGFEWGWGASFSDFDNDGDEDLLAVGAFPPAFSVIGPGLASPGRLYDNDGQGTFLATASFGLEGTYASGLAVGDFDGNGFPDAVIATAEFALGDFSGTGAPVLLQNEGNSNHWLTVRLRGTTSNREGVGAVIRAKVKHTIQSKQVQAGSSFASSNSPWPTFGLGGRDEVDLEVTWPSGLVESFEEHHVDRVVTLVEGEGEHEEDDDDEDAEDEDDDDD